MDLPRGQAIGLGGQEPSELLRHDPSARLSVDRGPEVLEVRDDDPLPASLEELDRRLDLRAHAPGRELARGQVLLRFGDRHAVEGLLRRLAEIQRDLRHVCRDHEMLPSQPPREDRGREVLVDYRLDADETTAPPDDGNAASTRGDHDAAVAVHEDLRDDARDVAFDAPVRELVPQRLREEVPDLRLALRAADVERHRRNEMTRLLVLHEDVADLGPVAVRDDQVVPRLDELRETRRRPLNAPALARRIRGFARREERVPTNRHDNLLHVRLRAEGPHYFAESIRTFGRRYQLEEAADSQYG